MFRLCFLLTVILLFMTSCNKQVYILENQDFNSGEWLLVHENYKRRLVAIDNEEILKQNRENLCVSWKEEDGGTTCDGRLQLYHNGELVAEQNYLDDFSLSEGYQIKNNYKQCSSESLYPEDAGEYKRLWDSLQKIPGYYPTRYHEQPDDRDIIVVYKIK